MKPFRRVLLAALRPAAPGRGRMSQFDLREWLRAAEAAGELNYRRSHPRALLFDEIAGYRPGRRVLTSSLSNPSLMGLSLGLGPGLSDHDLVEALRGRPG